KINRERAGTGTGTGRGTGFKFRKKSILFVAFEDDIVHALTLLDVLYTLEQLCNTGRRCPWLYFYAEHRALEIVVAQKDRAADKKSSFRESFHHYLSCLKRVPLAIPVLLARQKEKIFS